MPKNSRPLYRGGASGKRIVMKTATTVQKNAEDILAEANQINEKGAAEESAAQMKYEGKVE